MSVNMSELEKLNNLLSLHLRRKHIIVLNPEAKENRNKKIENKVVYDATEWKMPEDLQKYIVELSEKDELTIEEKILEFYEKLSVNYVYDDNLISYIQKVEDDTFDLPDWYGRDTVPDWDEKREMHNRRSCFELSRYLAKGLMELLKNEDNCNVCIFWDKDLTHYFVGLTTNDYKVTLDLDDFSNIKDLTRLKTELTAEGITILEDEDGKFQKALDNFNEGREKYALEMMQNDILDETIEADKYGDIIFLSYALQILTQGYGIDEQGTFEYMKEIVDMKLGPESRKKVWKKIDGVDGNAPRVVRCLLIDVDNETYLIDGNEGVLRPFSDEEFTIENARFIPFKGVLHDEDERYDGS